VNVCPPIDRALASHFTIIGCRLQHHRFTRRRKNSANASQHRRSGIEGSNKITVELYETRKDEIAYRMTLKGACGKAVFEQFIPWSARCSERKKASAQIANCDHIKCVA
jgi:hypothetical protein